MKKIITMLTIVSIVFTNCTKEENLNSSEASVNSSEINVDNNTINAKSKKINVVHNNHTININENALLTHLNHGDKIGTVEDNVILQGVVIDEVPLNFNDPIYVAFRNSPEFLSYNPSVFGSLDLYNAKLLSYIGGSAITIPSITKDKSIKQGLIGYVTTLSSPDNFSFTSLVSLENFTVINSIKYDIINLGYLSGYVQYFSTNGDNLVHLSFENNRIVEFTITPDDELELTCFQQCYKTSKSNCSNNAQCDIACGAINIPTLGLGWSVAAASCCAVGCAVNGGGASGCNE